MACFRHFLNSPISDWKLWPSANGWFSFALQALFRVLAVQNRPQVFVKYSLHTDCSKREVSPKDFNAKVDRNVNVAERQLSHNSPYNFSLWVTRENNHSIKSIFILEPYKKSNIFFLERKKHKFSVLPFAFSFSFYAWQCMSFYYTY